MDESLRLRKAGRQDEETVQNKGEDGYRKDSANEESGDAKGGPNNDRQITERAAGDENQK